MEVVVVHLLVPWDTVQTALLVLGIWGLLWMIGFLASLSIHPHLLGESALRVRRGATADVTVPWEVIAGPSVHAARPRPS